MITGAGVFLHNKYKVLLVFQEVSQLWSFPKGCKQGNETNNECWRRELKEETGIDYPFYTVYANTEVLRYNIASVKIGDWTLPEPHPEDKEIVDARWVSFSDIHLYKLNAVTNKVISDWLHPVKSSDKFKNFRTCNRRINRCVHRN